MRRLLNWICWLAFCEAIFPTKKPSLLSQLLAHTAIGMWGSLSGFSRVCSSVCVCSYATFFVPSPCGWVIFGWACVRTLRVSRNQSYAKIDTNKQQWRWKQQKKSQTKMKNVPKQSLASNAIFIIDFYCLYLWRGGLLPEALIWRALDVRNMRCHLTSCQCLSNAKCKKPFNTRMFNTKWFSKKLFFRVNMEVKNDLKGLYS